MASFNYVFLNDVLLPYLKRNGVKEVREVTDFDDSQYVRRGGCDTCGPDYDVEETIHIDYINFDGEYKRYSEEISFSHFLQELFE